MTQLTEFAGHEIEDTTQLGCGYDFRLHPPLSSAFLAVEVKGLAEKSGSVGLTAKEWRVATDLRSRFFLFVVKNFRDRPSHTIHCDPVAGPLAFERRERLVVQVIWSAQV